ncbi:MAG TPA: hypothetical protein VE343_15265 [Streptosporangiaceae bacterium]|nr:hypothetical protein [Streptosporangiaceae bacterium]
MAEAGGLDPDAAQAAIEHCYQQDWSDGLPLVPASRPLVDKFLAQTSHDPDEVIGTLPQVGRDCTVYLAAVNAAMAGCRPEYFPVVLAAFKAIMAERAARGGGWQSTSGPAPLIVANGPVRAELGFNSTGGIFGPGFRPNATVPRALGLIVRNAFGIRPQVLEQATQGIPGRWAICFGENEEESPWEPFSADGGVPSGTSAVSATLLRTCEFVDNRHSHQAEDVLWDLADTISRTGAQIFRESAAAVVLCPEHAQMFASAGYAKADVQDWLRQRCGRTPADLERAGKGDLSKIGNDAPGPAGAGEISRILASRRSVPVIVAGARNAAISMVARIFGEWSGTAFPVEQPASAAAGNQPGAVAAR